MKLFTADIIFVYGIHNLETQHASVKIMLRDCTRRENLSDKRLS